MCGINGIIHENHVSFIEQMNDRIIRRGPDDHGVFHQADKRLSLGMRRLSIIDLEGGHQPMFGRSDDTVIVFNGEVFNAPQLRKELDQKNYPFRTKHSDTEVILALYETEGEKCVEMLNGMFAFVIYDRKKNTLFGARDRFGIKPLFYVKKGNNFSFSSEIKALKTNPFVSRELNQESLWHYFTIQTTPHDASMLSDIKKLPAAHKFTFHLSSNALETKKYWHPDFDPDNSITCAQDIKETLRFHLKNAVERWTLSDVPFSCSLSGGLDSASVTALLSLGNKKADTFFLGFKDTNLGDERAEAKSIADKYDTNHHEILIEPVELIEDLPDMFRALDEPYAGGLPSWYVYKSAAKDFKVILTGTGGDELFGNYRKWSKYAGLRHQVHYAKQFLKRGALSDLISFRDGALHYPYFSDKEKKKFLDITPFSTAKYLQLLWDQHSSSDKKNQVAEMDLKLQLPEEFLMMTDRFSMNFSIEARTPFLDNELSDYVFRIPHHIRTNVNDPKYLLRFVMNDLLSDAVVNNPKKGFTLPVHEWMNSSLNPILKRLFEKKYLKKQGIFNEDILESTILPSLTDQHKHWVSWTLFCFQYWYTLNFENEL